MRRKVLRRSLSLMLTLMVALSMTCTAFAQEVKNGRVVMYAVDEVYVGYTGYIQVYDEDTGDDVTVTMMSSSDSSVGAIVVERGVFYVKGIAPGDVTITAKYKAPNGSEGSLSVQVKVKAIPKTFKSLKVCGKKVSLSKHPFGFNKKVKSAGSVKIKAPVAAGWTVKSVKAYAYRGMKDSKGKKITISKAAIKKGKKIGFAKKYKNMIVDVTMVNKTTGEKFDYIIQFYRKTAFAK